MTVVGVLLLLLVLLPITQESDSDTGSYQGNKCKKGWFGPDCTYKCYCGEGGACGPSGSCAPGVKCSIGYFGPACQYVNLMYTHYSPNTPRYLWDNNVTTCNSHQDAFILINLREPMPFYWVRILVKEEEGKHAQFIFLINGHEECPNQRMFNISNTTIDITCETMKLLRSFSLNGTIVKNICEVYVSGGRNVALKQRTHSTSSLGATTGSQLAVDGLDGNGNGTQCAVSKVEPPQHLTIIYSAEQIISRLWVVYPTDSIPCRMDMFSLLLLDASNKTLYGFDDIDTKGKFSLDLKLEQIFGVKSLEMFIPNNSRQSCTILSICEVETYGETLCPDNTFGPWCQYICDCSPEDVCHLATGACTHACSSGFYGNKCAQTCGSKCVNNTCYQRLGSCVHCMAGYTGTFCNNKCAHGYFGVSCVSNCSRTCVDVCDPVSGQCSECLPGFSGSYCNECAVSYYGDNCTSTCSPNCEDTCDAITGRCICKDGFLGEFCDECSPGMYGAQCSDKCPRGCKDNLCKTDTGECLHCSDVHIGPFCTDCPEKFYGPTCTLKCSSMCFNETCDPITGTCSACLKDYGGPQCLIANEDGITNAPKNKKRLLWFLVPIVLPLIVLTSLVVHFVRKKRQKQEAEQSEDSITSSRVTSTGSIDL